MRLAAVLAVTAAIDTTDAAAQVVCLDPNYTVSRLATLLNPAGMLYRPGTNDLLVTEVDPGIISTVDTSTGATAPFIDVKPFAHSTRGHWIAYVASNSRGELFVPIYEDGPVLRFDATGRFLGSFGFSNLYGAAFDSGDNFYTLSGSPSNTILRFPKDSLSNPKEYAKGFGSLENLAINGSDQIIATDRPIPNLWQVTPGCKIASCHTVLAGGITGLATPAIDPTTQNIFASDEFGNITRVTAPGVFALFAKGFSVGSNTSLVVDISGNIYAADTVTGTIWKFTGRIASTTLHIEPDHGGNTGNVTVNITGSGFQVGANVALAGVGADIVASNVTAANGSSITATFELAGSLAGARNLSVANPDGTSSSLPSGFTIEEGGGSQMSVDIIGLDKIRLGSPQVYYVALSNRGNTDEPPGLLSINLPPSVQVSAVSGGDLAQAGITTISAFGVPTPQDAENQVALYVSPGVPAGSTRLAVAPLTLSGSSESHDLASLASPKFTVAATWNASLPLLFDDYAAETGFPFIPFQADACTAEGLDEVFKANAADAAYASARDQTKNDVPEIVKVVSSVFVLGASATAVLALGLEGGAAVALGLVIAAASYFISAAFDPSFDHDAALKDLKTKGAIAVAELAAEFAKVVSPAAVTIFAANFEGMLEAADLAGSLNDSSSAQAAAWGTFQQRFAEYKAAWTTFGDCLGTAPAPPAWPPDGTASLDVTGVSSLDPNDKTGSAGVGSQKYVPTTIRLPYSIQFSNESSATAPARTVAITDQLDVTEVDLSAVSFGPISFGGQLISPAPFQTTFATTVDLRPTQALLVALSAKLNTATGLLTWTFESLDPVTGLPPTDPAVGFLPPGGQGAVFFTVGSKQGLVTDTQVQNQATIKFDANPPISTPIWTNTVDNTAPTSHVLTLPVTESSTIFTVQWVGADTGAGLQDFTLYVSDNGGPFSAYLMNTTSTSASFTGQPAHSYGFYSIARDLVGNIETGKATADATTTISGDTTPPVTVATLSGPVGNNGWYVGPVSVTLTATDPDSPVAATYYSIDGSSLASYRNAFTIHGDGIHQVSFYSVDPAGNQESSKTVAVDIDSTPPTITVTASPSMLWPPNGSLVPDTVSGVVSDGLSGVDLRTLNFKVIDSYGLVLPTGGVTLSSAGGYSFTVNLEARRRGTDLAGRQYQIVVSGMDKAGNTASASTVVTVPHDQGK
jgi:hypothetical protein